MPMKPLLFLSGLTILIALAGFAVGCSGYSPPPPRYTAPMDAKCRYEVGLAMASHQGRGVDGMVEGIIRETQLMVLCQEASTPAAPIAPAPALYCSDPTITNPHLLAECRARGR